MTNLSEKHDLAPAPRRRSVTAFAQLGRKADAGDDDAMHRLNAYAVERGMDADDYDTWSALADALRPVRSADLDVTVIDPSTARPRHAPSRPEPFDRGKPSPVLEELLQMQAAEEGAQRVVHTFEPPRPASPSRTNPFAVVALVLGILGGGLLAIIFGSVATSQIKRSRGTERGRGMAATGIVLGCAWTVVFTLIFAFVLAPSFMRSRQIDSFINGSGGTRYTSPDGHFAATFPTLPKRETRTEAQGGVTVTYTMWSSSDANRAFVIGTIDLPSNVPFDLDRAANAAASGAHGNLVTVHPTTVQGRAAVEFVASVPDEGTFLQGFVVRAPSRVYVVTVGGRHNPPDGYAAFKHSFALTP